MKKHIAIDVPGVTTMERLCGTSKMSYVFRTLECRPPLLGLSREDAMVHEP